MKKIAIKVAALVMVLVLAMSTPVMASPMDAVPQREENGVVFVPLRYAAYAHGFTVYWERETNSAHITSPVWETSFILSPREFILEAGGFIESGRTWITYETATDMFGAYSLHDAVVILHINDSHGRILSGGGQFGFYELAGLRARLEAIGATVLLFDSGDTFHGLPAVTLRQGLDIAEIMGAMGFDAMVAGNHDFNYGYRRLIELAGYADFPILAANVVFEDTGLPAFYGHTIIERDGTVFGIFGLATPVTPQRTHPRNVYGLVFTCPIEAAEAQVALLQGAGADFIIALTHVGVDPIDGITADEIAAVVDGIDIILDGHSHAAIAGSVPVRDDISLVPHPGTVIASTSGHMREIGVIVIQNGEIISRLVGADTEIPTCEATYALVYALIAAQDEILSEVIGHTDIYLDGSRPNIRTRQTNLGSLAANAMLEASGADVAFINGGGIRDSIAVGDITRHDLVRVFPFGNYVVTLEVPGSAILYALEHGLSAYPGEMGSFLQVAGVEFTFAPDLSAYERITSAYINGEPIVPTGLYIIATNDYLAAGPRLNGFPVAGNFNALEEILIEHFQGAPGAGE
ncbi:MAG: 5'-nucleotidase C-terminal domain-containing protein [Defluviitaleaceae bacterium]|nr:5'-nucleotidase C-terminal domain-containing protein [Defluviitaleaceae bacterium]